MQITIGMNGEVETLRSDTFEAFAPGCNSFPGEQGWAAAIVDGSCKIVPGEVPEECGELTTSGPTHLDTEISGNKVQRGMVKWELRLQDDLPVGKTFKYTVSLSTDKGACFIGNNQQDWFTWNITYPTKRLQLTVIPKDGCKFSLTGASCEVRLSSEPEMSDDPSFNLAERKRVKITHYKGGYTYTVAFPLEGTKYAFKWAIGTPLRI